MRLAVSREQSSIFAKMGHLELEELFSPNELDILRNEVENILAPAVKGRKIISSKALYARGRDVWRSSDHCKKIICHHRLAGIFADLTAQRSLKIAFDQVFAIPSPSAEMHPDNDGFLRWLMSEKIDGVGSIQGSVGGILICIKPGLIDPHCPVLAPKEPGSGIFFDAEFPIEFHQLYKLKGGIYLFISYAKPASLYVPRNVDPNAHFLKDLGYVFGDRLRDSTHPVLVKR